MPERVTLSRAGLLGVSVLLGVGALGTALALNFIAKAPLSFVMLITSLSPSALILLLYMGHLLRVRPEKSGYLVILKGLGLLSIIMAVLVVLDLLMPASVRSGIIQAKFERGDKRIVRVNSREQAVSRDFYDAVAENDKMNLETTPLFGRVKNLATSEDNLAGYSMSDSNKVLTLIGGALLLLPLSVLHFVPKADDKLYNMNVFIFLLSPSYVISLVAVGMWVKLLFGHVFQSVN